MNVLIINSNWYHQPMPVMPAGAGVAAEAIRRHSLRRVYPGAPIARLAREQGLLTGPADDGLEPAFHVSPELAPEWLAETSRRALAENPHFVGPGATNLPLLPTLCRIGCRLGLRPPLWRFTRPIRRMLRLSGRDPC